MSVSLFPLNKGPVCVSLSLSLSLSLCVCVSGLSGESVVSGAVRGSDRGAVDLADSVWMGSVLDHRQPLQELLRAQPALPGISVSLPTVLQGNSSQ